MTIWFVISLVALVMVTAIVVPVGKLGKFERERRSGRQATHSLEVERELYFSDVMSLQHVLSALLLVSTAALSVASFGWLIGVLVAAGIALEYGALARLTWPRKLATKYYLKLEPKLFQLIRRVS